MTKKRILILTGSPRTGGNSELLAGAFADEAEKAGHEVNLFEAGKRKINGCIACDACFSKGKACVFDDGFDELAPLLEKTDLLVLATPLYWFTFPAQLKAAIDKLYAFSAAGKTLPIKESFLIACAESPDSADFDGLVKSYEQICSYTGWSDRGKLLISGVNKKGDVKNTDALTRAASLAASL